MCVEEKWQDRDISKQKTATGEKRHKPTVPGYQGEHCEAPVQERENSWYLGYLRMFYHKIYGTDLSMLML